MTQIMPKFHLAFGGAGPFARLGEHRSPRGLNLWSPKGVAKSPEGDSLYAYPAGAYFSMKKSRQKSFRAPP